MTKYYAAQIQLNDSKAENKRRFRNILAASGKILESGEVRDIEHLYVMGRDGNLIRVADLNTDPEKQTENYAVKAQADHGEVIDGELVPSIEKQFGGCKVWLEDGQLHARMYFANNDSLADHAWAISEDASYSTGIDWYPDGYYGAGLEIDEPIGILREISMVLTGNDPRAKTIDTKSSKGTDGAAVGENKTNKKGTDMPGTKKSIDALTPDERAAMARKIGEAVDDIIDDFTTDVPESETQPTARDTKDEVNETEEPEKKEETKSNDQTKDTYHMPVLVIKDRKEKATQETETTTDARTSGKWLSTDAGKAAFRKTLSDCGYQFGNAFDSKLRAMATKDGITGLAAPAPTEQIFIDTMEKRDGILSHVRTLNVKSYRVNILTAGAGELGRAHGFKKGDTKLDQQLTATQRNILTKMVYKKLTLDAQELYENPELYDIRRQELVEALFVEIERAIVIGDGRTAPTGNNPDYRLFDGTYGFYAITADAASANNALATAITGATGENLYDVRIDAYAALKATGRRIMVAKGSVLANVRKQKNADGSYLVAPGARLEDTLDVDVIYSPAWFEGASVDAVIFAENAYTMIGETRQIREKTAFDTDTNGDVLLVETPRGGSLTVAKSAVTLKLTPAPEPEPSTPAGQSDAPSSAPAAAKASTTAAKTTAAKASTKAKAEDVASEAAEAPTAETTDAKSDEQSK